MIDFTVIGYIPYDNEKPHEKMIVECMDKSGLNTWVAEIGPDGGSGVCPYWWRPALSKDALWARLVLARRTY